ncbi:MAG: polyphosphate kinase 2 [Caulobacteraceae bacterium]
MTSQKSYREELAKLQTLLVDAQIAWMANGARIAIVLEGRDAAGKDGIIKAMTEHMSTRNTRAVALPKPSDREKTQWYFQRYVPHLPAAGEVVIFNRSWYNRGGVEPVMSFCTPEEHRQFLADAPVFEDLLIRSGVTLIKYWIDISKAEQSERLDARRSDLLKRLKVSSLDAEAQKRWKEYSAARDEMLTATHTAVSPWFCVRNNKKKTGRLNLTRHLIGRAASADVAAKVQAADPAIVFPFEAEAVKDGRLER